LIFLLRKTDTGRAITIGMEKSRMNLFDAGSDTDTDVGRLFEELYDPAFIIDADKGVFVGVNPAACEFLGYSSEEFTGLTPADIHPHEIARLEAFLYAVRSEGRWAADDLSCRAKNGGLLPAQLRASMVSIGGRNCILAIVHDRRDAELAELGRSIRKLTHDLRNTMVASRLMSDRLSRHDDPMVQRSAALITRSVDRAVRMCQAALEAGSAVESKPRRERFSLQDVVAEVCASIGPQETTGARVHAAGAESVALDADFDQMYRVLLNLVRNAIIAGSTRIDIIGVPSGSDTHIDVGDNGPGLTDAVRKQLFAEKAVPGYGTGAGLGLAIAWELVRNHGGELTLLETGAGGTVFRIALPAAGATPDELAASD